MAMRWIVNSSKLRTQTSVSGRAREADKMATHSPGSNAESPPPVRRLVLLGFKGSGKTSTFNTILRQKSQCCEIQTDFSDVMRWRLRVVDTPGWSLEAGDTPEESDWAWQRSVVEQCSPGPHALLLMVPVGVPFTEHHWQGLWSRVRTLGAGVWRHGMVLFTCADRLSRDKGVEEFIVEGGPALQRLVERCGSRYHTVDNTQSDDGVQVQELLMKVDEMVQENQGWFFEMVMPRFEEHEVQRDGGEKGRDVEGQPAMFRSPPRELRVLLVGWRGAGKSSVGNVLLGCRAFEPGRPTEVSIRRQALVAGRRLTIVDTPGWDWFSSQRTPTNTRKEIRQGAGLLHPGPHALLLVIPVVSTLTAKKRHALKNHLEMFGEEACLHTLVLFSCGDWLDGRSIEDHIQQNGGELLKLMQRCWNCYHVLDCTKASKDRTQVTELLRKIEEMVAENGRSPFLPVKLNQELDEEETSGRCVLQ